MFQFSATELQNFGRITLNRKATANCGCIFCSQVSSLKFVLFDTVDTLTTFASSAKCVKSAKPAEVCISKLACAVILIKMGFILQNGVQNN